MSDRIDAMNRNNSISSILMPLLAASLAGALALALGSCNDNDESVATAKGRGESARTNKLGDVDGIETRMAAGLIGSAHDFTRGGAHPRDLCTPCHMPHIEDAKAPLLDRRPAASDRLRPYEAIGVELDGPSLLCLSCHDGVIAPDVYTASHATRLARQLGASQLGIGGLTGHPIGVAYPVADPRYRPIASLSAGDDAILLPDDRVQCISCHDPHNAGHQPKMLVKSNRGSRLCLTCHRM